MTERIRIMIETRGAAFADAPMTEVARILRALANRAERDGLEDWLPLRCHNGNRIGELQIETLSDDDEEAA
jgi:hypothetical protein